MSDPFIGEIRMFAGNYAPRGWAFCDGQLTEIVQNTTLFALFGTIHGGDGRTTFGLPDMRGRIPIHAGGGAGPGLSPYTLGSKKGSETVTLDVYELPPHNHAISASTSPGDTTSPVGKVVGHMSGSNAYGTSSPLGLHDDAFTNAGGGQPHSNMMPTLCINFIVALNGLFPRRY
ncbi:MAG: tail fiber protein [Chloroflexota bacterium]